MPLEPDYTRPLECDVAIAGAGLVTGAILARHGQRVVLVDTPALIGGRGGATPHRGCWLDDYCSEAPDRLYAAAMLPL